MATSSSSEAIDLEKQPLEGDGPNEQISTQDQRHTTRSRSRGRSRSSSRRSSSPRTGSNEKDTTLNHQSAKGKTDGKETTKEGRTGGARSLSPSADTALPGVRNLNDTDTHHSQDDDDTEVEEDLDDGEEGGQGSSPPSVMGRVLSRMTSRSSYDPGPPPDGGWSAWSQCLASHLVIMNTWGWINSFGTFQAYYATTLTLSASSISWLGSTSVFLLFFIGTFTGRLVDAGLFRPVFALGTILLIGGVLAVSFSTQYWQLLLAQGLCMGLGCGCLFCPTLAVLATYFAKRRSIAMGIAACGSVSGGLVFPSIVRQLLPQIGFGWTIRVIGLIQLVGMIVANFLSKPRVKPRKAGPLVDLPAFKELEYTFYAAGAFCNFWGVYFAFFYIASFARDALDPPMSYTSSLNLLLIVNGVGVVGRLAPNYIADRAGAINAFIPASIMTSLLIFTWMAISSSTGLYVWANFYGITAGSIQSLFPAALSSLNTDLRKSGVRMGMVFTIVSFAVLTGPPIAGSIVRSGTRKDYQGAQAFAGSVLAMGCVCMTAAKVARMRKTGQGWMTKI